MTLRNRRILPQPIGPLSYSGWLYTRLSRIQDEMPEPPCVVCMLHDRQRQRRNLQTPERVWIALEHVKDDRPNDRWIGNQQDSSRAWHLGPSPPGNTRYQRVKRLTPDGSCVWIDPPVSETLRIVFGNPGD
jgi:hypothetical protein